MKLSDTSCRSFQHSLSQLELRNHPIPIYFHIVQWKNRLQRWVLLRSCILSNEFMVVSSLTVILLRASTYLNTYLRHSLNLIVLHNGEVEHIPKDPFKFPRGVPYALLIDESRL